MWCVICHTFGTLNFVVLPSVWLNLSRLFVTLLLKICSSCTRHKTSFCALLCGFPCASVHPCGFSVRITLRLFPAHFTCGFSCALNLRLFLRIQLAAFLAHSTCGFSCAFNLRLFLRTQLAAFLDDHFIWEKGLFFFLCFFVFYFSQLIYVYTNRIILFVDYMVQMVVCKSKFQC